MLNKDREVNPNINDHAWDSDSFEEKSDSSNN
jgi:hypothetical protein